MPKRQPIDTDYARLMIRNRNKRVPYALTLHETLRLRHFVSLVV
jgi:hypothetical protein